MELTPEVPLDDKLSRIENLAAIGAANEDIAITVDIPLADLLADYAAQIERGRAAGRVKALETTFNSVVNGTNAATTGLWLKSQCGWGDSGNTAERESVLNVIKIIRTPTTYDDANPNA
jgi:hypothetical protein